MTHFFHRFTAIRLVLAMGLLWVPTLKAEHLVPKFVQLNKDFNIEAKNQSFCYLDSTGEVQGHNKYKRVTTASVSKLITSLWAIEELGTGHRYETKFFLKGKKLHISGSLDPVFSKRKLFFLLAQLNLHGVSELEEITFNNQLRVYSKAENYIGEVLNITESRTAANLKDFWNTTKWEKLKPAYQQFVAQTPLSLREHLSIPDSWEQLNLKVGKVYSVEKNPLGNEGLVHLSPILERYLKFMNIVSNNYIADQVFDKLGGELGFDKYFQKIKSDLGSEIIGNEAGNEPIVKMFTGSGLNTTKEGARVDNYATCAVAVGLIERLDNLLDNAGVAIQKLVAVPGTDGGTFRKRLKSPRLNRTFVAKTGTLYHTSALAGILYGANSRVTFGIFHQLTGWKGNAKVVQNKTLESLWEAYAPKEKFEYLPEKFFPADTPLAPL